MKSKILILFAACLVLLSTDVNAQDIHFSQYYASPLTLNPALTGKFDGLWRVTGIYRDQYRNAPQQNPQAYMTPSASFDLSLLKNKLKTDALGVGAAVVYDQVGGLKTMKASISAAYHKGLDKDNKYHLGFGVQGTYGNRQVDYDYTFEEELISNPTYIDDQYLANASTVNSFDMNAGLFFDGAFTDWMTFYAGYSFMNILRHDDDFLADAGGEALNETPFRHVIHGGFEFEVSDKFMIIPGALYQTTASTREINFGSTFGYSLFKNQGADNQKKTTLFLGAWYRWDVAVIAKAGVDFQNFRLTGAYDIGGVGAIGRDLSDDTGASMPNAFEIAVSYFGQYKEKPTTNTYLFNPRF